MARENKCKKISTGRRRDKYKTYRALGTKEKNRKRRMARHIRHFPGDKQAQALFAKL